MKIHNFLIKVSTIIALLPITTHAFTNNHNKTNKAQNKKLNDNCNRLKKESIVILGLVTNGFFNETSAKKYVKNLDYADLDLFVKHFSHAQNMKFNVAGRIPVLE